MKITSLNTKFIVLLSILMALILAIQLYFNNQTQEDILGELNNLKRTINTTTDQILVERLKTGEKAKLFLKDSLIRNTKIIKEKFIKPANKDLILTESETTSVTSYGTDSDSALWVFKDQDHVVVNNTVFKFDKIIKNSKDSHLEIIEIDLNDENHKEEVTNILSKVSEGKRKTTVKTGDQVLAFEFPNLVSSDAPSKFRYNYNTALFNERLENIQRRNFWITLILFGLSIFGIAFVTAKFLKPIKTLNTSFDKVVQGDLDVVVESKSKDEIGELSTSFNHMVNELRKNKDKELIMQRQERLAGLGQLAAGVAHEIKNPLNAINLTIEHLQDKFVKEKNDKATSYINTIQKEIRRLDKTVNNLLSYLRSENLNKKIININALLDEIFELYEREIDARQIKLIKDYSRPCKLKIDAERFKTVVMNIILNAIHSMENGGELLVTSNAKEKCITIKDNGCGIPAKNLEHIFDLFYTTKSAGSGLGLPTAYKIVQEHGGDISIESEETKGTKVTISLP